MLATCTTRPRQGPGRPPCRLRAARGRLRPGPTFSMDSRMAYLTARWQISVMSAPEKPWVTCGAEAGGGGNKPGGG